ncbi:hypothetical protein B0H11DRAFT_1912636 [Mycena galericulata]|nr:hypothetical protein B0H11DRAFT_1912636 [Mycena galericulata]
MAKPASCDNLDGPYIPHRVFVQKPFEPLDGFFALCNLMASGSVIHTQLSKTRWNQEFWVNLEWNLSQLGSWAPSAYKFIRIESDGSVVWESDPNWSATTDTSGMQIITATWR